MVKNTPEGRIVLDFLLVASGFLDNKADDESLEHWSGRREIGKFIFDNL